MTHALKVAVENQEHRLQHLVPNQTLSFIFVIANLIRTTILTLQ